MRPVLKLIEHFCAKVLPEHFLVDLRHLGQPDTTAVLAQQLLNATLNFMDIGRRARGNSMCLCSRCIQAICLKKKKALK